jgi:hypothetical protein
MWYMDPLIFVLVLSRLVENCLTNGREIGYPAKLTSTYEVVHQPKNKVW